jgi:hypothetical protein
MFCALRDDLDDWGDDAAARVGTVAVAYRPRVRVRGRDPAPYLAAITRTALTSARRAHRLFARIDRGRDSKIVRSLWTAKAHLEVATGVLGEPLTDDELLKSLDEHRRMVAEQRRPPASGSEVSV